MQPFSNLSRLLKEVYTTTVYQYKYVQKNVCTNLIIVRWFFVYISFIL